jgi:hypothetical protein
VKFALKEEMLNRFNGQYCSIDDIAAYIEKLKGKTPRKTVVWNVNDLVRQGKAVRVGRGVYGFMPKPRFEPMISEAAERACSLLYEKFKYLDVTVTDSDVLGQFMNLQPFSTVVVMEAKKSATGAVLSALRSEGVDAYAKKDYRMLEQYVSSSQPFVVRPELTVNPRLPRKKNVRAANLEKLLVDLICDQDIYGQYQGEELRNIYRNATEGYAVNYSQMLKYAAARKKKAAVLEMLRETAEYNKIRGLL